MGSIDPGGHSITSGMPLHIPRGAAPGNGACTTDGEGCTDVELEPAPASSEVTDARGEASVGGRVSQGDGGKQGDGQEQKDEPLEKPLRASSLPLIPSMLTPVEDEEGGEEEQASQTQQEGATAAGLDGLDASGSQAAAAGAAAGAATESPAVPTRRSREVTIALEAMAQKAPPLKTKASQLGASDASASIPPSSEAAQSPAALPPPAPRNRLAAHRTAPSLMDESQSWVQRRGAWRSKFPKLQGVQSKGTTLKHLATQAQGAGGPGEGGSGEVVSWVQRRSAWRDQVLGHHKHLVAWHPPPAACSR